MLGKTEGRRRSRWQRMRWLDGITDSADMDLSETLGDSEGQGSLTCCSLWGHKELDTTQQLNNNEKPQIKRLGGNSLKVMKLVDHEGRLAEDFCTSLWSLVFCSRKKIKLVRLKIKPNHVGIQDEKLFGLLIIWGVIIPFSYMYFYHFLTLTCRKRQQALSVQENKQCLQG